MDKLKIAFVDFWGHFPAENPFLPILQKHFDVEIDEINPDAIIHTINGPNTAKYKCKKILFMAENFRASQFNSDYVISFDPHTDKNFFLPVWQWYLLLFPEHKDLLFNRKKHENFERFCYYIVTNGGNFMRNSIYTTMSSYKRVHSYGKYMTNDYSLQNLSKPGKAEDGTLIQAGGFWRQEKLKFLTEHPHKFGIAFENTCSVHYCTEKIMDAFLSGSIPIYWGDPHVWNYWNKDAFIDARCCWPKVMEKIKEMDTNKSAFDEMYNQPVFTEEQQKNHIENMEYFETWLVETIKK